jgi:S1-C subfamily serine protease
MSFNVLSQSQMKDFIKDLKGAVQIEAILPDSPNKNQFKVADIITHVNGTRVDSILELYQTSRIAVGKKIVVNFIREGNKKTAEVKQLDVTDLVDHSQKEIVKAACKIDELKSRPLCK